MSKQKKNKALLNEGSSDSKDFSVFLTVFWYCILIIFFPVISFFMSQYLLENFNLTPVTRNIYAAVIAVINLHIALGLYLYKAYSAGDTPKETMYKQD